MKKTIITLSVLFSCLWELRADDLQVPGSWQLQAALNASRPGDTITIEAGATITGNFILPAKSGVLPVTIRTSRHAQLPNRRITPADAPLLAKLVTATASPVLAAAPGAARWNLLGLEITSQVYAYQLIELGSGSEASLALIPADFDLDRLYIHGHATLGSKRGLQLNCQRAALRNSYLSAFTDFAQDTQAVAGWNGPGPFQILNNYLEASGENVLFGGAIAALRGLVPSDIVLAGNHIAKPLAWKSNNVYAIKNLVQLKNAQRVLLEGNILENNWPKAQSGIAVQMTVRTEGNAMPWAVVQDVTFSNNWMTNVTGGFSIRGRDDDDTGIARRIRLENNIMDRVSVPDPNYYGPALQLLKGVDDVTIDHLTLLNYHNILVLDGAPVSQRLIFRNNIALQVGGYGVAGAGTGVGTPSLAAFAPGYVFRANALVAASPGSYPAGNFFPSTLDAVGFTSLTGATPDYRLTAASPYRSRGTDGNDLGANVAAVVAATATARSGALPAAASATVTLTVPATAASTAPLAISWQASGGRPGVSDWIGLFSSTAAANDAPLQRFFTGGAATGSLQWPATAAGSYAVRYVRADGATSATASLTVSGSGGDGGQTVVPLAVDLSISPVAPTRNSSARALWTVRTGTALAADRVALYRQTGGTPLWSRATQGRATGSVSFTAPAAGSYVLHYLSGGRSIASISVKVE